MIGRESDLAALRDELQVVTDGEPRAVVIGGEAGIGKTRLLDEFRAEAADSALVLTGKSVDLGTDGAPYAPFTGILRQLVDAIGIEAVLEAAGPGSGVLSVLLPELSAVEGVPPRTGVERLYELITVLFENVSSARPVVVIVEDIHWADTATLELVRFVIRMIASGQLLLLLSYRSDEVLRGHPLRSYLPELDRTRRVTRWELRRLDRAQVAEQAELILGCVPDSETVDRVYQLSEGVPFFVEELVGIDHLGTGEDLPETLRELLLARYERLSEPTQRMLRLISAGGICVDHELLEAVFEGSPDDLDAAAREAVVANVLSADTTEYTFRHALVREAIHADLLPGERTRFHTRYAQALEHGNGRDRSASQVSYHWMAAHDLRRAFIATLEATEEARLSYAYRTAAAMGDRVLELWDQVDDAEQLAGRPRVEVLSRTASALRNAGDSERALALVNAALADPDALAPGTRARLLRDKAQYLANISRPGSVEALREALDIAPVDPDDRLRPQLLAETAGRLMIEARFFEAAAMATSAIDEAGDDAGARKSIAHTIRGIALIDGGEIEQGLADLESARRLAGSDTGPLLRYSVNASDAMYLLGRYDDAVEIATAGARLARDRGVERTSGVMLSSNTVEPLLALGELDRAESVLEPALALDPPPGFRVHLQRMKLWLTLWRGDASRADELVRRWRPGMLVQSEIEMQSRLGFARLAAEVAVARGDSRRAWADARIITTDAWRSVPSYDLPLLAVGARALAGIAAEQAMRGPADAEEPTIDVAAEAEALEQILGTLGGWPTAVAWGPVVRAELAEVQAALPTDPAHPVPSTVGAWEEAVEAVSTSIAPVHLLPYARLRLAESYAAHGDRVAAVDAASAARDRADELGLGLIVRAVDDLRERAVLTRHSGARTADTALTEREAQVLALIEQGLSNKQIGERLYISAKTASVHVSSILKKVGATSRTEAVYRAARVAR